jgi:hypothetical protein
MTVPGWLDELAREVLESDPDRTLQPSNSPCVFDGDNMFVFVSKAEENKGFSRCIHEGANPSAEGWLVWKQR